MNKNIRNQIYQEALWRINIVPNVIIETERRNFRIHEYIHTLKEEGNLGGDLELSIVYDIFNNNNNKNKNLLILVNEGRIHFMVAYYNNTILDLNYNPINIIVNKNNKNQKSNNNINDINKCVNQLSKNTNRYIFKDLTKYSLKEILNYYDDNEKKGDNLADIYYYIYNKTNKKEGKFSQNFYNKYKNSIDIRKKRNHLKKELKIIILVKIIE